MNFLILNQTIQRQHMRQANYMVIAGTLSACEFTRFTPLYSDRHRDVFFSQGSDGLDLIAMETQGISRSLTNLGIHGADATGYSDYSQGPSWTQRVMDEMKDMLLILNAEGRIAYSSLSCKLLTGHSVEQLTGQFISSFLHEHDKATFARELEEAIASGRPLRLHFRFGQPSSAFSILEAYGHPHIARQPVDLGNGKTGKRCDGVFLICRPYTTKTSQLLDSFLEHKMENIRLCQRIADLKREEEEDAKAIRLFSRQDSGDHQALAARQRRASVPSSESTLSHTNIHSSSAATEISGPQSDLVAIQPGADDMDSDSSSTDNVADKAPPAEEFTHIDGIEVITGLRYGDGERSQGLSTGDRRGRLVQYDIDITTASDQHNRSSQEHNRRKKVKAGYMCADCGTYDSPEWRKGPKGPKTLCNACGLRWSKKEKKRHRSS
ncbi:hypothetical protein ASPZODRAFT_129765 [Penicilliopsis zonata CBS 506.65]|uniref:GATA-type domain-containing protein n=1 Tax=Penicilliopsis zonata CBS 506.65 TaxID=1073090 RepID=A0A1L9SQ93_9EURO|nr:hypothetical protein ASPZODRAFT_129765 [Penicilliopsis zonata CBS 506.65]OJJ49328.1 hypothetical protein ASPZODRAFT_129765 [Penicilliopsis zonata CBS 506.65]